MKITKVYAKKWLPPTRQLIRWYEGKGMGVDSCPFCMIRDGCDKCPWEVFGKMSCGTWKAFHYPKDDPSLVTLRDSRPSWWCKVRLSMLRRWEREMVKALKGKPK